MKYGFFNDCLGAVGRSPHGERGLKSWPGAIAVSAAGRSPHGERGLKYLRHFRKMGFYGRSPHGERGLKFVVEIERGLHNESLPPRGAWIEITLRFIHYLRFQQSLPPRGAWIEITGG